jgi:hypothetical protein
MWMRCWSRVLLGRPEEGYIHEIGSFSGKGNHLPMNPRDMPKMSLEEARKKYIGKK